MQPKVELAKTRDFGEIIGDTFLFLRQNFKPLLKNLYLFCGILFLAGSALMALQQYQMLTAAQGMGDGSPLTYSATNQLSIFGVNYFIGLLLMFLGNALCILTILSYMALYKQKGNVMPTSAEVWSYVKYYIGRTLLTTLVVSVLLGIAFLFCLIPGFYLFPIFGLVYPIIVFENGSFNYSFSRSFQLIKNNWWVTGGAILVSWIIMYFMMLALALPASVLGLTTTFLRPASALQNFGKFSVISTVLIQLLSLACYSVPTVTLAFCYFNLSESKEGTSLLERINNLGTNTGEHNLPTEEY